jgi:hypothetical protein
MSEKKESVLDHRCYCQCHQNRGFKHAIMCCIPCDLCGLDIARYLFKQHKPYCKERNKILEQALKEIHEWKQRASL